MGYLPFKIVYISNTFWSMVPLKYFTNPLYLSPNSRNPSLWIYQHSIVSLYLRNNKLTLYINIIYFSKLHFNQSTTLKLSILSCALITTKTFFVHNFNKFKIYFQKFSLHLTVDICKTHLHLWTLSQKFINS